MKKNKTKRIIKVGRPFKRRPSAEQRVRDAFGNVPNITNETVAEHREDVLGSARKYIYPLKHSRRRAVVISSSILVVALIVFMAYVGVSLYRFQSTSGFIYGVTKVIPFPVAKTGDAWVSYNSYLFELRHLMHYYSTQQSVDFTTESGQAELASYKQQSLKAVKDQALVKQLAKENDVSVTDRQVSDQVTLVRAQNRLGTSDREFEDVLNKFWGWNINDFRRSLKQQMLAQAVVAKLDTSTVQKADAALAQLVGGADFAAVAGAVSEDPGSKANGGQYSGAISRNDADIPAAVMNELFRMQPGQTSKVINTGFTLEIVKINSVANDRVLASHIVFNFKLIEDYVKPLRDKQDTQNFIKI